MLVFTALPFLALSEELAAASPSAKLVYVRGSGAESCPAEAELRKAVAVRIGYDPFFTVAQKTVVAQVERIPKGYRSKVQIVGDDGNVRGERDLSTTGEDCLELVGALALAVSIALDDLDEAAPASRPTELPASKEAEPVKLVTLAPSADVAETPPPSRAPKREVHTAELAMSLGPTVSIGTAPDAAAGASLAAALRWQTFALRLDIRGELPATKAMPRGGRVGTNVVLATASGCVCGRIPFVCLGAGSGVMFSATENITHPAHDRTALFVGTARGGADLALSPSLYLEPFGEVGVNLLSPNVAVDGQTVYETAPIWGTLGIHLGARLL
jgi:hypothetical protein